MKKLTLKMGGIKEMLTKEQMKKVVGGNGYGSYTCTANVNYNDNPSDNFSTTVSCGDGGTTLQQCQTNSSNYCSTMVQGGASSCTASCQ